MTILKKQTLSFKIQKTVAEKKFVLFFQHNNIKNKQWALLKNLVLKFDYATMIVCKNKLVKPNISYSSFFSNTEHEKSKQHELMNYVCQGPTVIIACDLIDEFKNICKILNIFKKSVYAHESFFQTAKAQQDIYTKNLEFLKNTKQSSVKDSLSEKKRNAQNMHVFLQAAYDKNCAFPSIFTEKKQFLVNQFSLENNGANCLPENSKKEKKSMPENKKKFNAASYFFLIGGYVEKQFVDFLDLKKIYKTNQFLYSNLAQQVTAPIQLLLTLHNFTNNQFVNTLNINEVLPFVLELHKANSKEI